VKNDNNWKINGVKTDSAKTAGYLRTLFHLSSNSFEDNVTSNSLGKADYTLTIESVSKAEIVLTAYKKNPDVTITSTENEGTFLTSLKIIYSRKYS